MSSSRVFLSEHLRFSWLDVRVDHLQTRHTAVRVQVVLLALSTMGFCCSETGSRFPRWPTRRMTLNALLEARASAATRSNKSNKAVPFGYLKLLIVPD